MGASDQVADPQVERTPYTPLGTDKPADAEETNESSLLAQIPEIDEIIKYCDKELKRLNSVVNIPDKVLADPVEFMHTVAANKIAVKIILAHKKYLQARIKAVLSKQ